MQYKALSIVAPNGQRIATGEKSLEVRRWIPDELPLRDLLIVENHHYLMDEGAEDPDGRAVALVDVVEVFPWRKDQLEAACGTYWEEGWMAWRLVNARPVVSVEQVVAKRKIYNVTGVFRCVARS